MMVTRKLLERMLCIQRMVNIIDAGILPLRQESTNLCLLTHILLEMPSSS
jgi:hypothetical protein